MLVMQKSLDRGLKSQIQWLCSTHRQGSLFISEVFPKVFFPNVIGPGREVSTQQIAVEGNFSSPHLRRLMRTQVSRLRNAAIAT